VNIPPRGFGIVALCSLRVREVPGSIPGIPLAIGPWTSPGLRFNNLTPLRMCSMIVADFFFHFLVPLEDRREQSTGRRASRKEENWGFPPSKIYSSSSSSLFSPLIRSRSPLVSCHAQRRLADNRADIPPRGFGIVALCSLRVREVPGSIPGIPRLSDFEIGPWASPGLRYKKPHSTANVQ
jgi:hypothetical protein